MIDDCEKDKLATSHKRTASFFYCYSVIWSEEDQVFVSRCQEMPGLSAHGDTAEEALREILQVAKDSVDWILECGDPIPKPGANHA